MAADGKVAYAGVCDVVHVGRVRGFCATESQSERVLITSRQLGARSYPAYSTATATNISALLLCSALLSGRISGIVIE